MRVSRRMGLYSQNIISGPTVIFGAPGEVVMYSGKSSGSVTLDETGAGTVDLKAGVYSFAGSISQRSGFTISNVRVKGQPVTMWPAGIRPIYWFGRMGLDDAGNPIVWKEDKSGHATYSYTNTITKDRNNTTMHIRIRGDAGARSHGKLSTPLIDLTGYTSLGFVASMTTNAGGTATAGYADSNSVSAEYSTAVGASVTPAVVDISGVTGEKYLGFHQSNITFGAVWRDVTTVAEALWLDTGYNPIAVRSTPYNDLNVLTESWRHATATEDTWELANVRSDCNYFGQKSGSRNTAMFPIGSFTFTGSSIEFELSMLALCPAQAFADRGFRWAISTTEKSSAYTGLDAVTPAEDPGQLASGTATIAYVDGHTSAYTLRLPASDIPSGTQLYLYFWPYGDGAGVAHVSGTMSTLLWYREA